MITRTLLLAASVAALSALWLSTPSHALPAPGGNAPQTLTAGHDGSILLARGGGGMRGGGGGMRGGGGGMRGGGGFSGGGRSAGNFSGATGRSSFGGGADSRGVRSSAASNVNFPGRNANAATNRNFSNTTMANRNINNVNVNNINGACRGGCGGWGNGWDHPVAAAAAIGAAAAVTSAAIGSVAYSLPPDCGYVNGYYQCGSTWYQPQYAGTDVQYVAVEPPPQ